MRIYDFEKLTKPDRPIDPHIFAGMEYSPKHCSHCRLTRAAEAHDHGDTYYETAARQAAKEMKASSMHTFTHKSVVAYRISWIGLFISAIFGIFGDFFS